MELDAPRCVKVAPRVHTLAVVVGVLIERLDDFVELVQQVEVAVEILLHLLEQVAPKQLLTGGEFLRLQLSWVDRQPIVEQLEHVDRMKGRTGKDPVRRPPDHHGVLTVHRDQGLLHHRGQFVEKLVEGRIVDKTDGRITAEMISVGIALPAPGGWTEVEQTILLVVGEIEDADQQNTTVDLRQGADLLRREVCLDLEGAGFEVLERAWPVLT